MKLMIDGYEVTPEPNQSLLDMVKALGLNTGALSHDPLAARIAGEVFTLNYIPVREKDAGENPNTRRAMAASDGCSWWWLRSDKTAAKVPDVDSDGSLSTARVNGEKAVVRPAIWILY